MSECRRAPGGEKAPMGIEPRSREATLQLQGGGRCGSTYRYIQKDKKTGGYGDPHAPSAMEPAGRCILRRAQRGKYREILLLVNGTSIPTGRVGSSPSIVSARGGTVYEEMLKAAA